MTDRKYVDKNPFSIIQWQCQDEKGIPICNFSLKVLNKIEVRSADHVTILVTVKLCFEENKNVEKVVPLSDIDKVDWSALEPRCTFYPGCRNAKRYLENLIRTQLDQVPCEIRYRVDGLGINHFEGSILFVAGEQVITCSSSTKAIPKLEFMHTKFRLDIDLGITAMESFNGMKELISLSPETGRVLVAHAISGIIRTAFKEAGFVPCAVLVIIGKSGMLKSHYVPQLVQLYNRGDEIKAVTRFNSSQSFIEAILSEYSECTAVIDDLHSAASRTIRSRNETTAEEIIRRISDDTGRGHKVGNTLVQEKFRGNAVFIGEYVFGKESTIPRALVVEITKRPDGKILDKYQRQQPLLVSTFYYFFIQWYVNHFNEIRDEIDVRLTKFRETMSDSGIHGRLCDTQFYLQISYMVFLEFCKESGFISQEDCLDEYKFFYEQVANLIQIQQERFRYGSGTEEVDYLKHIQKLYKEGRLRVAEEKKAFKPDKHDGVICYDCLCLRGNCLERKLKNINARFSLEDCVKNLLAQDALKLVEQKNTVQISGTGGKRFYAIKLSKLH